MSMGRFCEGSVSGVLFVGLCWRGQVCDMRCVCYLTCVMLCAQEMCVYEAIL